MTAQTKHQTKQKSFRKNKKSFQINTLIWLMAFFLTMGLVILPYFNTYSYDENHPPPPNFPIAVRSLPTSENPILLNYRDFQDASNISDISEIWSRDATFDEYNLEGEFTVKAKNLYELKLKSEIFTQTFRYKVDEKAGKIIPLSFRTTGWVIWFYAIIYLIIATVLVTVGQWLRFWWKTSFTKK